MENKRSERPLKKGDTAIKKIEFDIYSLDLDKEMDVISLSSEFNGNFHFGKYARIEGKVDGSIRSTGTLIIGEQARVKANIDGCIVMVSGMVNGDITASRTVSVEDTAIVNGIIKAPNVIISDGAVVNGNIKMSDFHKKIRDLEI